MADEHSGEDALIARYFKPLATDPGAFGLDDDAAVLRVRASLGAQLPLSNANGFSARRRHYWIDVGVAPDGTLNIERVTPIDEDPQLFVP